jgi:competence protein ComEC
MSFQKRFATIITTLILLSIVSACNIPLSPIPDEPLSQKGFTVYFIDVGQADSALVVCNGASMLIDGGNVADSDLIYTFLKNKGIKQLDYIVATHAHEDHVGGLAGALNYATVDTAFSPVTEYDTRAFENFVKYLNKQGKTITIPVPGDTFMLGSAEVIVLAPINPSDEPNNMSIVLKIVYGETSFLFTGDAEREEEADILEVGYDISATVLKVGHHGSESSTSYPFLREVMPQYAVISCGQNNSYGHPHDETLSKLRDAEVVLYRTDMQGTIICTSDGTDVSFSVERNAGVETNPTKQG